MASAREDEELKEQRGSQEPEEVKNWIRTKVEKTKVCWKQVTLLVQMLKTFK